MDGNEIWRNISLALGAEPREYAKVVGASGLEHQFLALAIEETKKRLILFSGDPDARTAALIQSDIQATMPSMKVLVTRPIAFDLGEISRKIAYFLGSDQLDYGSLSKMITESQNGVNQEASRQFLEPILEGALPNLPLIFRELSP